MALRKNLIVKFHGKDVLFDNCYFKVSSVRGDKTKVNVTVNAVYSDNETVLVKDFVFTPSMDSGNFIAQAYNHLKTLPEFAGSVDC